MVLGVAGLVRIGVVGVVGVGLATAAYALAGLAIRGFRPVAAGVVVMLTGWGAGAGVVGVLAGWVVGGVGGSGSATGMVGAAGFEWPGVASEGGQGCGVGVGNGWYGVGGRSSERWECTVAGIVCSL